MKQYTMTITIDAKSVCEINKVHQRVTLARKVAAFASTDMSADVSADLGASPQAVAWLTLEAGQTIVVSWEESYSLYATTSPPRAGARIVMNAHTPATPGVLYPFGSDNLFGSPGPAQASGTFSIDNQVGDDAWLFGLAQGATIGGPVGPIPLNIIPALNDERVALAPSPTVYVFLQSSAGNGVPILSIPDGACPVRFTTTNLHAHVAFWPENNTFHVTST